MGKTEAVTDSEKSGGAKKSRGAQPGNRNSERHGAFRGGLVVPYLPPRYKHLYVRAKEFRIGLEKAVRGQYGGISVPMAETINATALAHSRLVLVAGYLRKHEEKMTADQVAQYIGMLDRFAARRHKLVKELKLDEDPRSLDFGDGDGTGDGAGAGAEGETDSWDFGDPPDGDGRGVDVAPSGGPGPGNAALRRSGDGGGL